jgi:hypothetical protein
MHQTLLLSLFSESTKAIPQFIFLSINFSDKSKATTQFHLQNISAGWLGAF